MTAKKAQAQKTKTTKAIEAEKGEQLDLIDVHPKNAKPIIKLARAYKVAQAARQAALKEEVELKQKILELVKGAKLQPLEGGLIAFEYDGVEISIKPRDELLTVKDRAETE